MSKRKKCLFSKAELAAALARIRADPAKNAILLECQRSAALPIVKRLKPLRSK